MSDRGSVRQRPHAVVGDEAAVPAASVVLLARSDAELVAAQFAPESWERFVHAHLAALRAAAAVVAFHGRPSGRRAPRNVWDMLSTVTPELSEWAVRFAAGAGTRTAIEAGRFDAVTPETAESLLCDAEDFVDEVRGLLSDGAATSGTVLALRAS
ncbi:MAG TPA: SAV_6107 family HEPN domain-containing protein [Cellulomonadaceae bacterium]|nr:SAV_6107 family HEPN domain-containing protein [Cellulomonadaceae bacterium]